MSPSNKINDLIALEAQAAESLEAEQGSPIPSGVRVARSNTRSKVLQIRLNADELAAIERIADRRELPVSTIAREQLLKLIAQDGLIASDRRYQLYEAADLMKSLADTMRTGDAKNTKASRR